MLITTLLPKILFLPYSLPEEKEIMMIMMLMMIDDDDDQMMPFCFIKS